MHVWESTQKIFFEQFGKYFLKVEIKNPKKKNNFRIGSSCGVMSFVLFDFDFVPPLIEREKTPDEMLRERKLNELTNALFEASTVAVRNYKKLVRLRNYLRNV
mgnify:CR=1 FL=1